MDKQELMHERKRALKVFKEDLEKDWDKLVEEAKRVWIKMRRITSSTDWLF